MVMQDVINKMKGIVFGVVEYLILVFKVRDLSLYLFLCDSSISSYCVIMISGFYFYV